MSSIAKSTPQASEKHQDSELPPPPASSPPLLPKLRPPHRRRKRISPVMWLLGVLCLTSVAGNRFYNQPKLNIGTKAPETIRAPYDASVEDTKATEDKRQATRNSLVPFLMLDRKITQKIYQEIEKSITFDNELRSLPGSFPFVPTDILSKSTQLYVRQTQEWQWRAVLAAIDRTGNQWEGFSNITSPPLNPSFSQAVIQLQSYRRQHSPQAYNSLLKTISQARQRYAIALTKLPPQTDASLLNLSNETWKQTQTGIRQAAKPILTQGIPLGLPTNILQQAVSIQVSSLIPANAQPTAIKLLMGVLRPNLKQDKEKTQQEAEQAVQTVKPSILIVRQGQVIVYAGEEITQADFVLLDYFGLSRRGINWLGLIRYSGLFTCAIGTFWLMEQQVERSRAGKNPHLRRRDHFLVLLLCLSTPLLGTIGARYTNLPAIGWLVGSFYGPALGITVVGSLTGLVTFSLKVGWDYLLAGAAGGALGAIMAGRMRSREELALLGGGVGLTQGVVYLLVHLIFSATTGSILTYTLIKEAVLYSLSGLAWSIVALGVSPYLEHLFDLVTPIRLAELSNPNRPLLKRLAAETPGTFQHTLLVATLAEAAARELNCNVELVRAGTLYHDIGKMHDPMGFIENQMGSPNKHDEINDPWKSAEIIKKHVTVGLVMARKHRLPKAIQAFIPEHQGTILIAYFYHQAEQLAQQNPTILVREEDFRYPGPIPQSRETGIVMLADACEAALRTLKASAQPSLKDTSPETALSMINKILRARWQDNQLVDSGLTREDLSKIAEIFVQVWQQTNHQRIAYPKLTVGK